MQNPTTTQEFVYVIHAQGTNRIKLGFSTKPKERLAGLQTASPYPLQILACWPGNRAREDRLHRYMAQFRKVGEWFEVPPFCGLKLWELTTKGEVTGEVSKNRCTVKRDLSPDDKPLMATSSFNLKAMLPLLPKGCWWDCPADGGGIKIKARWKKGPSPRSHVFARVGKDELNGLRMQTEDKCRKTLSDRLVLELNTKGKMELITKLGWG